MYSKKKALWNPHRVYTKRGRDNRYTKFITNINEAYSNWNIIALLEAFAQENEIDVSTARKRVKDSPILLEQFVISHAASVIRTARPDMKSVGKEVQEMVLGSKDNPSEILYLHREGNPDMYFINGERILFYKDKLKNIDGELVSAEPLTTLWDDILSNNLHKEGNVSFPKGKKPEYIINPEYDADMLAAAVALHEGFTYQPDGNLFWKQSVGNENSYLFVTTRHLTAAYLDSIKSTMEEGEYLIIACRSFDAGLNKVYNNITIKKIPQMLLNRCEFGKTDYNLNIVHPPVYDDDWDEEDCNE